MGSTVAELSAGAHALREKLAYRRTRIFQFEDGEVLLTELTAGEASQVWSELTEAELSGNGLDAYCHIVLLGAREPSGDALYATIADVRALPARLVVPMAQAIMDLTEIGLESKKEPDDRDDMLPRDVAHRLALACGRVDVDALLSEIPLSAYAEWIRYARREPFGAPAWDQRIGYVLSVIVTALTGKPAKPSDFVPSWGDTVMDWREMRAVLHAWGNAHADHRQD